MDSAAHTVTRHTEVRAVLSDPAFVVPPAPPDAASGGVGWLRASVARFSDGEPHQRRRQLVIDNLSKVDVADLRDDAFGRTCELLRSAQGQALDFMAEVARVVPIAVLARALGMESVPASTLAIVAMAYHPQSDAGPEADRAVRELVDLCGGVADEETASRIGLLVQAYDATAGLVGNAVLAMQRQHPDEPVDDVLVETLRHDPPVRVTRRLATAAARVETAVLSPGTVLTLDLAAANRDPDVFANPERFDTARANRQRHLTFGAGPHACPGRDHAIAVATGILQAVRTYQVRLAPDEIEYEPSANLRVPVRLLVRTP